MYILREPLVSQTCVSEVASRSRETMLEWRVWFDGVTLLMGQPPDNNGQDNYISQTETVCMFVYDIHVAVLVGCPLSKATIIMRNRLLQLTKLFTLEIQSLWKQWRLCWIISIHVHNHHLILCIHV